MLSFLNLNKNLFTFTFFIIFLILGILIFPHYGISIDEDNTRINGLASLKYIFEIFLPELINNSDKFDNIPSLHDFKEQGIGAVFDLPMAYLEYFFDINDARNYYLLRHFFNFIFFFTSVFFFFLILKKRYDSNSIGILGAFFLISSPRIFADSFYNNKDIIFLSLFVICLYFSLIFLEKPNIKNTVLFSLTSALCIDIRILGIILPSLILFFYFLKNLNLTYNKIYFLRPVFIFFILTPLFIILFWPYLWENPFDNFISIFKSLSSFDEYVYNFYFGEYVLAQNIPWHYSLVWMFFTIPMFYIFLFIIGFLSISKEFYKNLLRIENNAKNNFFKNNKEMLDLVFFSIFLIPLTIVIILNSTLYDGWRHLYFLYPGFLLISMSGLYKIMTYFMKKNLNIFLAICILFTTPTIFWMIKNHPYQYVYFNSLAGNKFNTNFEMDYWGLSNSKALEYIAKNEKGVVYVSSLGTTDLNLSQIFLKKKYRHKLKITSEINNSKYIINNYRNWLGKYIEIPANYEIFYEIKIGEIPINTIYKKKTDAK